MSWFKEKLKLREQLHDIQVAAKLVRDHANELNNRKDIPLDVSEVIIFLLEETIDVYESIATLYKKGHMRSCVILSRSLFENAINLRYILKENTEQRAVNYKLFSLESYLKRVKNYKEDFPGKEVLLTGFDKISKKRVPEGPRKGHWDGKSLKEICAELKCDSLYSQFYSRLSGYIHSQYQSTRDLKSETKYNQYIKKLVFQHLFVLILETLKVLNNKYNILEGGAVIEDYPETGTTLFFSVSHNDIDNNISKYMESEIQKNSKKSKV